MDFPALAAQMDRAVLSMGGPVRYEATSGGVFEAAGMFDALYVAVDAGTGQVDSAGPSVFLRVADLPETYAEDTAARVVVGGVRYRIRSRRTDGIGGVRFMLHEE